MRRTILAAILALLVLSCANCTRSHEIKVTDSHGKAYRLSDISTQLREEYGLEKNPIIMVLLTNELDDSRFNEQLNILNKLNAEAYQYIYVVGAVVDRDDSGYSLSSEDAMIMLSGNEFQIRIYDEYGKLEYSSSKVLSEQELKNHLTKILSGR